MELTEVIEFMRRPRDRNLCAQEAVCYICWKSRGGDLFGSGLRNDLHRELSEFGFRLSSTVLHQAIEYLEDVDAIEICWDDPVEGRGRPRRMFRIEQRWDVQECARCWEEFMHQTGIVI